MDIATKNQTRPNCARVKVEVDLIREFSKCIKIGIKKKGRKVIEKWIKIKYDYVPKYCKTCIIQVHDEQQCFMEHSELFQQRGKAEQATEQKKEVEKGQK